MKQIDHIDTRSRIVDLVKWWIGSFGLIGGATSLGTSLASFESLAIMPLWAQVCSLIALVIVIGMAGWMILSTADLFIVPSYKDIRQEERESLLQELSIAPAEFDQLGTYEEGKTKKQKIEYQITSMHFERCLVKRAKQLRIRFMWILVVMIIANVINLGLRSWAISQVSSCNEIASSGCTFLSIDSKPETVIVHLNEDQDSYQRSSQSVASQLGGEQCDVPQSFEALAIGGTFGYPILQAKIDGCNGRAFVLSPDVGIVETT